MDIGWCVIKNAVKYYTALSEDFSYSKHIREHGSLKKYFMLADISWILLSSKSLLSNLRTGRNMGGPSNPTSSPTNGKSTIQSPTIFTQNRASGNFPSITQLTLFPSCHIAFMRNEIKPTCPRLTHQQELMEEQTWYPVPARHADFHWLGFQAPCSLLTFSASVSRVCPISPQTTTLSPILSVLGCSWLIQSKPCPA